jgi:hypothetical protein
MSVNCNISIPVDVDEGQVSEVVGVLAGLNARIESLIHGNGTHVEVDGVEVRATSVPGMAEIVLRGKMADGESAHSVNFHYCSRSRRGKIVNFLHPPTTPFWCAVGKRLVDFFGGEIVYDDCREEKGKNVYRAKRSCPVDRQGLIPDDGKPWRKYQLAVVALRAVSGRDLKAMRRRCQ